MTPSEALLQFPCAFPIKVMGRVHPDLVAAVVDLCRAVDPAFDAAGIEQRASGAGRFVGLTVTVEVPSREHLEGLYRALSAHPLVAVVL